MYDQESIMVGNDYRKINYTLNASSKIKENIEIGLNSNAKYYEGREERSLWDVYTFNPVTPVYERAGITTAEYDHTQYNYGDVIRNIDGNNEYHWNEVYYGNKRNPLAEIDLYDEGYNGFQVFASPYLKVEPVKGLTVLVKGAAKFTHTNESYFYPPTIGTGETKEGAGSKYDKNWRQLSGFAQATYETKIGAHWLKAMAVYEAEDYQYKWASAAGKEYPMWEIANELGDAVEPDWIGSGMYEYSKLSYLASIDYGFADKYYLTGSFRRDGSSRFGPDNRWGNFGSIAATWRISEESFIKNLGYINNLKLRVSYGITGNDGIGSDKLGYYMYQGVYGLDGNYNQQKAAYVDGVENTQLAWEGNKNGNIALEYKVLDRIWGTVEYYDRRSDRLLLYKRIPYTAGGQSTMSQNIGEIKNSGWELSIGAQLINRSDLNWDINLTYTANENEILEWYGDNWSGDGQTYRDKGGSMYNLRMKKWAGVDADTGSPLWYKEILDGDDNPTGKTTITNDWEDGSYYDVGDASPDFFGGITNNISYKNFDFSFMFYYSVGNYAYNNIKGMVNSDGAQPRFQLEKGVNDSWSEPGDQTEYPKYVTNDPSHAWWRSTRFLQRSDFLKLKNVTLGYSLPESVLNKLHLGQCRVFVMGENLWTLTEFTGYDPELSLNGDTNGYVIPPMTSITMGLNLTF